MRKQYHFWPGLHRLDAWDVDRLIELSRDLPVIQVPLTSLGEIDTGYWGSSLTPRGLADHMRLVEAADLSYPIILGPDGRVMDGMHRVVRALLAGAEHIDAVQFAALPDPDFTDCVPEDLPYPRG
jgi:hypothetical protein